MRVSMPLLMTVSTCLMLTACDRKHDEPTAEAKASVAAVSAGTSSVNIDVEGFKANIEIPGIEFGGDKMDINGLKLPPGTRIKAMRVQSHEDDSGSRGHVQFDFASPMTPDATARHLEKQAAEGDWGKLSRSVESDGTIVLTGSRDDDDTDNITYRLKAVGGVTQGTASIVDQK